MQMLEGPFHWWKHLLMQGDVSKYNEDLKMFYVYILMVFSP
jgi:hypothetical protein